MRFLILALLILAGCDTPKLPSTGDTEADKMFDTLMLKSILVNSSDAIVYGDYRVVRHRDDLVHPEWRVEHKGSTAFVGQMTEAMEWANERNNKVSENRECVELHYDDGEWVFDREWKGYPFVRWRWTWPGRTNEKTIYVECPRGDTPQHPSKLPTVGKNQPGTKGNL